MHTIYALEDQRHPEIHAVFYIGITEDVYVRFSQHLQCNDGNIDKNMRIQEMKNAQVMLIMRAIEIVDDTLELAKKREQHWIQYYLSQGVRLLNVDVAKVFTYDTFMSFFGPKQARERQKAQPRKAQQMSVDIANRRKPLTIAEVASVLGCSERYVRDLRLKGTLEQTEDRLITATSVRGYLASRKLKVS